MKNVLLEEIDDISLDEVFLAYYQCRKNKRNKLDCLEFDLDYEIHLIKLWEDIKKGDYVISPSSVFIVDKPVKREICAANFRDRIVHHLIVMKLEHLFEKEFIYDSYSCRKGKGTHFGISRLNRCIKRVTNNYQLEAYVLKLDIKAYFMSINKIILLKKLIMFLTNSYKENDIEKIMYLCRTVINNDVTKNCAFKSSFDKWNDLPKSKSLFGTSNNCGLAIGNYTSQVCSNFYLNGLDHFIKSELKIKYYGRYVDDFYLLSNSKEELKECIPKIKDFLQRELRLEVHPKKIYLQNINRGVEFLGCFIKPWRIYITPRIKNNLYLAINEVNKELMGSSLSKAEKQQIQMKLNSYLGTLGHYNTYNLRVKLISLLNVNFWHYFALPDGCLKIVIK